METTVDDVIAYLNSTSSLTLSVICRNLSKETLNNLLISAANANASPGFDGGIPPKGEARNRYYSKISKQNLS